jgi:hypothetical protein
MQLSGMTQNPFNKPARASRPASKAPIKPSGKSGGKHPHSNLGKFLHPKKGR